MCKLNAEASCVWNFNSSRLFQGKKYKFTFFVAVLYLKTSFKVNKSLNTTTWPRNFLRAFPPRNTQVAQIHRMIYNILLPRRADTWFPSITPRECTDGPSTLTSYPNFLGWIVYQIFLSMVLRWRVLRARESSAMTKLIKVSIGNNQRVDSWKCTSTETLDKNRKTLILVFRCWHYKNKRTKSTEIVWGNEWNVYFQ